jgi:hypothetical protein
MQDAAHPSPPVSLRRVSDFGAMQRGGNAPVEPVDGAPPQFDDDEDERERDQEDADERRTARGVPTEPRARHSADPYSRSTVATRTR